MFKVSHTFMIILSGLIWLAIGVMLMSMGLNFIVKSILVENLVVLRRPVLDFFANILGGYDQGAIAVIALALIIGFFKGRFVLKKTVGRTIARIRALPNPAPLSQIYHKAYYLLIAVMMTLGFILKFVPLDIRGGVDVVVGSALINGAILYFRHARPVAKNCDKLKQSCAHVE